MSIYRYSGWDESQDLFDLDADRLMDELGRDLMSSGDLSDSLRQMQRDGIRDSQGRQLPGTEELLQRLCQMRQSQLEKYGLHSVMDEIRQKLAELPPSVSSQISELTQYDFTNEESRGQVRQAQSSLASLSPEDREPLENVLQSVLDEGTREDSISYTEALRLMEMLQKMDKLEAQMRVSQNNRSLDIVDEQLLRELMGDEMAEEMERLRNIPQTLEEAGYIRCKEKKYELTPRGMRKIGQKALEDIFVQLIKDRVGGHNINLRGTGGEKIDETKRYESGDDFQVHLQKTIMNSLYREPRMPPIRLNVEDFEVFKTEGLTRSATVLMLDLSLSMPVRGRFETAKRVALALDGLIRSQYPKDSLYIVGFSSYARRIRKEDLPYISWDEFDIYTNIQHGLRIARKLLAKEMCTNKQIILVTDGEPTAHVEGENTFFHEAPPRLRTLQLTVREVRNCTRQGIVINTFMLENNRFLSAFVTQMARVNKGRVFFTSPDSLGQYLLVDYISNKRRRI